MNEDKLVVSLRAVKPAEQAPAPAPKKRWVLRLGVGAVFALVFFGLCLGAYYIYIDMQSSAPAPAPESSSSAAQASSSVTAASAPSADQTAQIVAQVGELIELPQGETPTVATVNDPSKLQGQAFFVNAKVGDIVLLYTQAREAYLYDPTEHKLVAVAPLATTTTP